MPARGARNRKVKAPHGRLKIQHKEIAMETIGIASILIIAVIVGLVLAVLIGGAIFLYATQKVWLSALILWLAEMEICFDEVKEGYVAHYESGGKFMGLACSYGEFRPVKMPGDLNWAIRRPGEEELLSYKDSDGTVHPPKSKKYKFPDDFQDDMRLPFVKKLFGNETGIVWMGWWPTVKPRYYTLRISNFRTVRPDDEEIKRKNAKIRVYTAGGNVGEENAAGFLVSWNEESKQTILSDDNYPIPVDGVRIGVGKKEAVVANILVIIRGRIREPYLFFYRAEDTLETIQNEMIQRVRQLCAEKTIDELYTLKATLQSDQADVENEILKDGFGAYIRERYGFSIKSASIAYLTILGAAGEALSAPFIAAKSAEAAKLKGQGEGDQEFERLTRVGTAFTKISNEIGLEGALGMRSADVAQTFAENKGTSTVVLGFDSKNLLGSTAAALAAKTLPSQAEGSDKEKEK